MNAAIIWVTTVIMFILSLFLKYKEYEVEGNKVVCYSGWKNRFLILNGEIVDKYRKLILVEDVELKYKDDFHEYNMTVSLSNHITLKVDGNP